MTDKWVSLAAGVTLALGIVLSVVLLIRVPGPLPGGGTLWHLMGYAALTIPLSAMRPRWALWIWLGAVTHGALMELIQPSFGRTGEWADLWADALGAALGVCLALGLRRLWISLR